MDQKLFLSSDDFESKRLNKSFFTNITKGISVAQLQATYPPEKFDVFNRITVENWIKNTYELTGGEIVKGGFNDTEDIHKVLTNMRSQVTLLKGVVVEDSNGFLNELFVLRKPENIEKSKDSGEDDKNKLEKAIGNDDSKDSLEKGNIRDAVFYSDLKIQFSKTGKEIKAKLEVLKTKEDDKLTDAKNSIATIIANCAYAPTESIWDYTTESYLTDYKTFKYDMCWPSNSNSVGNNIVTLSDTVQGTLTDDECCLHREYNDLVYRFKEAKAEVNTINFLIDNLEDSKKYELTARQMLNFGF